MRLLREVVSNGGSTICVALHVDLNIRLRRLSRDKVQMYADTVARFFHPRQSVIMGHSRLRIILRRVRCFIRFMENTRQGHGRRVITMRLQFFRHHRVRRLQGLRKSRYRRIVVGVSWRVRVFFYYRVLRHICRYFRRRSKRLIRTIIS